MDNIEKLLLLVLFIAVSYYPLCGIVGFIEFVQVRKRGREMTREEAIKQLELYRACMLADWADVEAYNMAIQALEQEPKTGYWITQWNVAHQKEYYYCSECREEFSYDGETGIKMNDYRYCPNCGAKMESEEL